MNKIIEFFKKNYPYFILTIVIICSVVLAVVLSKKENKENIQIPEIKLEQKVEKPTQKVKVDIKGNISHPGVYELEEGSRVIDVINLAGGLLENSNTELINLSKKLIDEMTIIIYSNEQIEKYRETFKEIEYVYIEIEKCPDKINDACINQNIEKQSLISINNATIEELTTLSGIGEAKANDIIEYRNQNGRFETIEDIKKVSGIGDTLFEKIKDFITI